MSNNFVHVGAASEIREQGRMRVNVEGRNLAIFYHEGEFHAVDNRCPHMGFPLSEGTVENGILTCHWHHARFDLACGDTFDLWADDVPSYPTEVRDGELYVAANPRGSRDPIEYWTERLTAGLRENLSLIVAKSVVHLMDSDLEYTKPVRMGVEFGTAYREDGWGSGLTTLGVMANLVDYARAEDVPRALYKGLTEVASDTAGSAPLFRAGGSKQSRPVGRAAQRMVSGEHRSSRRRRCRTGSSDGHPGGPRRARTRPHALRGGDRPPLSQHRPHSRLHQQGLRDSR